MTDQERDKLITEMHTDISWIKTWCTEHKAIHAKYIFYFIGTAIVMIISFLK